MKVSRRVENHLRALALLLFIVGIFTVVVKFSNLFIVFILAAAYFVCYVIMEA